MIIARNSVITRLLNKENYRSIIAYNFKKSVLILSAAIAANSLFQLLLSVQDNANDAWYTISGMKLDAPPTQPGLYIRGKKKVMVK